MSINLDRKLVLWLLLLHGVAGCPEETPPLGGGLAARVREAPTRFVISLLLADGEALLRERGRCAVPIRGGGAPDGLAPETGLLATIGVGQSAVSDEDGVGALVGLGTGIRLLEVVTRDGAFSARVPVQLSTRRTNVEGRIIQVDDSWVMMVEVLPDDDGDRVSDDGTRASYVFAAQGAEGHRHLGDGRSERVTFDADYFELAAEPFPDRDGDFLADDDDPDTDGDGVPDIEEADSLPCPGFSHDELLAEGSPHLDLTCESCHRMEDPTPLACDDCHSPLGRTPDQVPAVTPADHFLRSCEQCHLADRDWAYPGPSGELHGVFPLLGKHLENTCMTCHVTGDPRPSRECEACHLEDAAPDHFREGCEVCHGSEGWKPPIARHDQFPLTDGHAEVVCGDCHLAADYAEISPECAACHLEDAPMKHVMPGFTNEACDTCHVITTFADYDYDHLQWSLLGRHAETECSKCHELPDSYVQDKTACSDCHAAPGYPDHTNLGTACANCHVEEGWVPALEGSFDHAFFPLVGAHGAALCSTCHESGAQPNPPNTCEGCHAAEKPVRHTGFFDGTCEQCHQPTEWTALLMPHEHTATFPLNGVHLSAPCSSCHVGASYDAPTDCVACHQADEPPNHYGNACADCHGTANWNPTGELNHHSVDPTAFPLSNGHGNVLCSACHQNGFAPLPESCEACHLNDQPVGHANDGCASCHVSGLWLMPFNPVPNQLHPLEGQHVGTVCIDCHGTYTAGSGFAAPAPATDCASCHTLPGNHIPTGNQACDTCHQVTGWTPALGGHAGPMNNLAFPYDTWTNNRWFPPDHRSANQCADCHTQANNFAFFSCTDNCHLNQNSLSNKDDHQQAGQFHYDPNAAHSPPNEGGGPWPTAHVGCVKSGCHPRGN